MNPVGIAFGRNLRQRRERLGLSQEDLAFAAGLHRTEVGLLERGGRIPRIDTLVKLASSLSVPPSLLLEGIAWHSGSVDEGRFTLAPEGGDA